MLDQLGGASSLTCCCLVPAAPGLLITALIVYPALLLATFLPGWLTLRWLAGHLTEWGDLSLRLGTSYAPHDIKTQRSIVLSGIVDNLDSRYGAGTLQAFGELGYGIDVKPDTRLEPFVNLARVQLNTDAITEQGGIAALSSAASSTNVTFATLGMRAEHAFSLGAVEGTLSGMVGWRQACGDTAPQADVSFAGGNAFSIAGTPVATSSAIVEAGLDLSFSPNARVGLSYGGSFTSVSTSHNVRASLAVQF